MSEHCQYIVFPDDGRDPFVVETHPFPEHISDDLGGAMACSAVAMPAARCMMWVREDATTTGYERNTVASIMATLMNNWRRPTTIVGPAVLTTLVMLGVNPETGGALTGAEGFDAIVARGLATVAADVRRALDGSDGPFETDNLDQDWASKVRAYGEKLAARPIADDWPNSENRPEPVDHISAALEAAFPGRRYVPYTPEVG